MTARKSSVNTMSIHHTIDRPSSRIHHAPLSLGESHIYFSSCTGDPYTLHIEFRSVHGGAVVVPERYRHRIHREVREALIRRGNRSNEKLIKSKLVLANSRGKKKPKKRIVAPPKSTLISLLIMSDAFFTQYSFSRP